VPLGLKKPGTKGAKKESATGQQGQFKSEFTPGKGEKKAAKDADRTRISLQKASR